MSARKTDTQEYWTKADDIERKAEAFALVCYELRKRARLPHTKILASDIFKQTIEIGAGFDIRTLKPN